MILFRQNKAAAPNKSPNIIPPIVYQINNCINDKNDEF